MTALPGGGVYANVSHPPGLFGVAREILGSAAAEPQRATRKQVADLAEVGWEVGV